MTRTPRQAATETSPSKRSTCVLACRGDVGLGDARPQTGRRKGQTLISRGPGGWTCRTGSGEHRLPGSQQAPGPSWVLAWQRRGSADPVLSSHWCHRGSAPCPPSNPGGLREAPAQHGRRQGQAFHVCALGERALNPAITPVVHLAHTSEVPRLPVRGVDAAAIVSSCVNCPRLRGCAPASGPGWPSA